MLKIKDYKMGLGGNIYYVADKKNKFKDIAFILRKPMSSVYWSKKYETFVMRIKNKSTKALILNSCGVVPGSYKTDSDIN